MADPLRALPAQIGFHRKWPNSLQNTDDGALPRCHVMTGMFFTYG